MKEALDCLQDVTTHNGDFKDACAAMRDHARPVGGDTAAYWQHQLATLDRMKGQAERGIGEINEATAQTIAATLKLATLQSRCERMEAALRHIAGIDRPQMAVDPRAKVGNVTAKYTHQWVALDALGSEVSQ